MRKTLFTILFSLLIAGIMVSHAQTNHTQDTATQQQDSTINVIGWFSKNDTVDYWISESQWKFNGIDTIKTAGLKTKVRLLVTDSTSTGYKMTYTFIDFIGDTIPNSPLNDFQNRIAEKLGKKIAGTSIRFETDEY